MATAAATELRIATIGNVDAGKSTLVGCLTRDIVDDGRGSARSHCFQHVHEKETGRTSAISVQVMGMDAAGATLRTAETSRVRHFQAVRAQSKRIITFVDLAGHEKYLKTTISGLTGLLPDYCLVIVGLNMGVSKMTREHLGLSAALDIPPLIVCTKVDIAPPDVAKHTMESITKVLRAARKMPYVVRCAKDVETACSSIAMGRTAPIVTVSSVTGEGMDLLRGLLQRLPHGAHGVRGTGGFFASPPPPLTGAAAAAEAAAAAAAAAAEAAAAAASSTASPAGGAGSGGDDAAPGADAAAALAAAAQLGPAASPAATAAAAAAAPGAKPTFGRCTIDSVFSVPGVGTVVAGTVLDAAISTGHTLLLGPSSTGVFIPVTVRSIEINYTAFATAPAGVSAAFAIRVKGKPPGGKQSTWCRKGMHLLDPRAAPHSHWAFVAESLVLHHSTTVKVGYAPQCHVGVTSQSAQITAIESLRPAVGSGGGGGGGGGVGVAAAAAAVAAAAAAAGGARNPGASPGKPTAAAAAAEAALAPVAAAAAEGGGAAAASSSGGEPIAALRTGDRALLTFRFLYRPEFLNVGDLLLFREGRSKGVGRIVALLSPQKVIE